MPKSTLAYALASRPLVMLAFGATTGTTSIYLPGAGTVAGDGIPMPYSGTLLKLRVFDGSTVFSDDDDITFAAGDRLSVYCQNVGSNFTVRARLNGVSTALQVTAVPFNSTLQATLAFAVNRT